MKAKLVGESGGQRTFVLVLDPGEEALATIAGFAARERVTAASLTAIGAFSRAVVGWFDLDAKTYRKIAIDRQCEVLSAIGDIVVAAEGAQANGAQAGKPALHLHVVLGLSDGTTRGGHLMEGTVCPTLEVTLVEQPAELRRTQRPEYGIALIDLGAGG